MGKKAKRTLFLYKAFLIFKTLRLNNEETARILQVLKSDFVVA